MSMKVRDYVLDYSKQKGGKLLILITIAKHCKDDGTGAWPNITTIAKGARLTRKQVSTNLKELRTSGELIVQAGDHSTHGANKYQIIMNGSINKEPHKYLNGYTRSRNPLTNNPKAYLEEYAKWRTPLVV